MHRKMLKTIALFLSFVCLLSGCANNPFVPVKYTETVSLIALSESGKSLFVIGDENDYQFVVPSGLKGVLTSDVRKSVSAQFSDFHVGSNQHITGIYSLHLHEEAPEATRQQAIQLGFKPDVNANLVLQGKIEGDRYWKLRNLTYPKDALSKAYKVEITSFAGAKTPEPAGYEPPSKGAMAVRILLAPILIPILFTKVCLVCGR
jgi:hypothetical protein